MAAGWDANLGGRAALWRRPGKPDQAVRFLDRITVKAGRPPAATVIVVATKKIEAAALDELFTSADPKKPYAAPLRFAR